jgi:hypothetical protein
VSSARTLGRNRHAIGAVAAQTCAPSPGIVEAEGGGSNNPTLSMGGGAVAPPLAAHNWGPA